MLDHHVRYVLLRTLSNALFWGVPVPFLVSLSWRRMCVRGTRLWSALNEVVMALRPLVRPCALVGSSFDLLRHAVYYDGSAWMRMLNVTLDLVFLRLYWKWAKDDEDEDDGDGPWTRLGRRVKGWVSAGSSRLATGHV